MRKSEHKKHDGKEGGWWKGLMFGSLITSAIGLFSSPKRAKQARKKLTTIKNKSVKKLVRNSKLHAQDFAKSTKKLAKNISKDVADFKNSIISDEHYKE